MAIKALKFKKGFRIIPGDRRSQAAEMVLAPGDHEGGPDNRHRGADQWLYVVEGRGVAILDGITRRIAAGTLVFIERGTRHEIRNSGKTLLRTLNLYVPPAYDKSGKALPRGRR